MRYVILMVLLLVGCSGDPSSPTDDMTDASEVDVMDDTVDTSRPRNTVVLYTGKFGADSVDVEKGGALVVISAVSAPVWLDGPTREALAPGGEVSWTFDFCGTYTVTDEMEDSLTVVVCDG